MRAGNGASGPSSSQAMLAGMRGLAAKQSKYHGMPDESIMRHIQVLESEIANAEEEARKYASEFNENALFAAPLAMLALLAIPVPILAILLAIPALFFAITAANASDQEAAMKRRASGKRRDLAEAKAALGSEVKTPQPAPQQTPTPQLTPAPPPTPPQPVNITNNIPAQPPMMNPYAPYGMPMPYPVYPQAPSHTTHISTPASTHVKEEHWRNVYPASPSEGWQQVRVIMDYINGLMDRQTQQPAASTHNENDHRSYSYDNRDQSDNRVFHHHYADGHYPEAPHPGMSVIPETNTLHTIIHRSADDNLVSDLRKLTARLEAHEQALNGALIKPGANMEQIAQELAQLIATQEIIQASTAHPHVGMEQLRGNLIEGMDRWQEAANAKRVDMMQDIAADREMLIRMESELQAIALNMGDIQNRDQALMSYRKTVESGLHATHRAILELREAQVQYIQALESRKPLTATELLSISHQLTSIDARLGLYREQHHILAAHMGHLETLSATVSTQTDKTPDGLAQGMEQMQAFFNAQLKAYDERMVGLMNGHSERTETQYQRQLVQTTEAYESRLAEMHQKQAELQKSLSASLVSQIAGGQEAIIVQMQTNHQAIITLSQNHQKEMEALQAQIEKQDATIKSIDHKLTSTTAEYADIKGKLEALLSKPGPESITPEQMQEAIHTMQMAIEEKLDQAVKGGNEAVIAQLTILNSTIVDLGKHGVTQDTLKVALATLESNLNKKADERQQVLRGEIAELKGQLGEMTSTITTTLAALEEKSGQSTALALAQLKAQTETFVKHYAEAGVATDEKTHALLTTLQSTVEQIVTGQGVTTSKLETLRSTVEQINGQVTKQGETLEAVQKTQKTDREAADCKHEELKEKIDGLQTSISETVNNLSLTNNTALLDLRTKTDQIYNQYTTIIESDSESKTETETQQLIQQLKDQITRLSDTKETTQQALDAFKVEFTNTMKAVQEQLTEQAETLGKVEKGVNENTQAIERLEGKFDRYISGLPDQLAALTQEGVAQFRTETMEALEAYKTVHGQAQNETTQMLTGILSKVSQLSDDLAEFKTGMNAVIAELDTIIPLESSELEDYDEELYGYENSQVGKLVGLSTPGESGFHHSMANIPSEETEANKDEDGDILPEMIDHVEYVPDGQPIVIPSPKSPLILEAESFEKNESDTDTPDRPAMKFFEHSEAESSTDFDVSGGTDLARANTNSYLNQPASSWKSDLRTVSEDAQNNTPEANVEVSGVLPHTTGLKMSPRAALFAETHHPNPDLNRARLGAMTLKIDMNPDDRKPPEFDISINEIHSNIKELTNGIDLILGERIEQQNTEKSSEEILQYNSRIENSVGRQRGSPPIKENQIKTMKASDIRRARNDFLCDHEVKAPFNSIITDIEENQSVQFKQIFEPARQFVRQLPPEEKQKYENSSERLAATRVSIVNKEGYASLVQGRTSWTQAEEDRKLADKTDPTISMA